MAGMDYASMILQGAGTAAKLYGNIEQYSQTKATTKYNQAILDANQIIDEALIDADIRRIREEGESLLGTQRAIIGKSGTKFSGSNLDVFLDTVRDIELDVHQKNLQKTINRMQTYRQKEMLNMQLKDAKSARTINAASILVQSGSQMLSQNSSKIAQSQASK